MQIHADRRKSGKIVARLDIYPRKSLISLTQQMGMSFLTAQNETKLLHL